MHVPDHGGYRGAAEPMIVPLVGSLCTMFVVWEMKSV